MKLQVKSSQAYPLTAIDAAVDRFEEEPLAKGDFLFSFGNEPYPEFSAALQGGIQDILQFNAKFLMKFWLLVQKMGRGGNQLGRFGVWLVVIGMLLVGCQQELEEGSPAGATPLVSSPTLRPPAITTQTASLTPTNQPTQLAQATMTLTPTFPAPAGNGALIGIAMNSQVGVLLDEIPAGLRDQAVATLLDKPDDYWLARAKSQVELTMRRLNFRNANYPGKGQLPLPPDSLWNLELSGRPNRQTIQGHDLILVDYTFATTLLTNEASPAAAEPQLAQIGGQWQEPFTLPLDPQLLFQRTDNACLNESWFPPNSYDSENSWIFYDFACTPDSVGINGCHRTITPSLSCLEALEYRVGYVETTMTFERLAWDAALADRVRVGPIVQIGSPDLQVVSSDLGNYRIAYRYFTPNSCAVQEQCVTGTGWRRLLQFDATVHNVGTETFFIGPVVAEDSEHNLFVYNSCHDHFHFSHYGLFSFAGLDQLLKSKQAFCVESTSRFSNNEYSPLTHNFNCQYQGIEVGWVDEYQAGLDCQWVDITDLDLPAGTTPLTFTFNPDGFLCEGSPVLDEQGQVTWETTDLIGENGEAVDRPVCQFVPGWADNNVGQMAMSIAPAGSFVTEPCQGGQVGPLRNCDFTPQPDLLSCSPGATVELSCAVPAGASPQVLRICETSQQLGIGLACTLFDSLANTIVGQEPTPVSFTCPFARDAQEPGGGYALYTAPLLPGDSPAAVSCQAP